jgi:hypothetical protein
MVEHIGFLGICVINYVHTLHDGFLHVSDVYSIFLFYVMSDSGKVFV